MSTSTLAEALEKLEPPKKQKIFFRLYYDKETGKPVAYSMEELDGDYIEITAEQFAMCDPYVIVEDGQIVKRQLVTTSKLVPGGNQFKVHATDISLVDPDGVYWSKKQMSR